MPDDLSSLDERMAALDNRIQTLRQRMPPRPVVPPAQPRKQQNIVQDTLWLFAIAACVLLVYDAIAIFAQPDELVLVTVKGHELHVWRDPWEFEAATGKSWTAEMPDSASPFAIYHGARRSAALQSVVFHILLLVLSVAAICRLRQERKGTLKWSDADAKGTG
jgi:hypothetical protein